jgi:hypothetical protein
VTINQILCAQKMHLSYFPHAWMKRRRRSAALTKQPVGPYSPKIQAGAF